MSHLTQPAERQPQDWSYKHLRSIDELKLGTRTSYRLTCEHEQGGEMLVFQCSGAMRPLLKPYQNRLQDWIEDRFAAPEPIVPVVRSQQGVWSLCVPQAFEEFLLDKGCLLDTWPTPEKPIPVSWTLFMSGTESVLYRIDPNA